MPFLELVAVESDAPRHQLERRDVQAGDALELWIAGHGWVRGRYEWNFSRVDAAWFYYVDDDNRDRVVLLAAGAVARWPK